MEETWCVFIDFLNVTCGFWGVSGESSLNPQWRGFRGIPSMTLSFFYSFSSQITHYLGCLHSGVLAWINSPKKVSFSFVYVQSSYSQSSLDVTNGKSLEPTLCYRMMLIQLQWHWQTPVLAPMAGDKSTPLSCLCQVFPALGSCTSRKSILFNYPHLEQGAHLQVSQSGVAERIFPSGLSSLVRPHRNLPCISCHVHKALGVQP